MNKRPSTPKTQYSPSNPLAATSYHLMVSSDTGSMTIVGNSSVKRLATDGILMLNDGRQGKVIISGINQSNGSEGSDSWLLLMF